MTFHITVMSLSTQLQGRDREYNHLLITSCLVIEEGLG